MHRGRVLPRKFRKIHNWAKSSPRYNPAIMHRTKIIMAHPPWVGAGSLDVSTLYYYCRVDRNKTGASGPRGGCARDFVNFRGKNSCIARARRGRARKTVYPPMIQIADVVIDSSQSCDRKSKFGLRHAIKLIEIYGVTKSEFGFSTRFDSLPYLNPNPGRCPRWFSA